MNAMNYHHLYYFWMVVQQGGLAAAARKLKVTHSTLSTQLRTLEEFFGGALFERKGRRLVITPFGDEMAAYAEGIFRLGQELVGAARGKNGAGRTVLRIGVAGTLPKTLTHQLLEPALVTLGRGQVQVQQDLLPRLIESLANGRLHLVLSDEIPSDRPGLRIHSHVLGETEILLFAVRKLAAAYRKNFPASLQGAQRYGRKWKTCTTSNT